MALNYVCDFEECEGRAEYEVVRTTFVRELSIGDNGADADAVTENLHACGGHLAEVAKHDDLSKRFTPEGKKKRSA